jgi:hypothetical protein
MLEFFKEFSAAYWELFVQYPYTAIILTIAFILTCIFIALGIRAKGMDCLKRGNDSRA